MMDNKKIVIFGTPSLAKSALLYYGNENVKYFVDNGLNKIKNEIDNIEIIDLEKLKSIYKDFKIVIASTDKKEFEKQLVNNGIYEYSWFNIKCIKYNCEETKSYENKKSENKIKKISVGALLESFDDDLNIKNMIFSKVAAGVLEYSLIRAVVKKYNLKKYLEIGSFIGESVDCVYDLCDELLSIGLPDNNENNISFFNEKELENFSGYFLRNKKKLKRIIENPMNFDFSSMSYKPDILYVDMENFYNYELNEIIDKLKNVISVIDMSKTFIIIRSINDNYLYKNKQILDIINCFLDEKYSKNFFCFDLAFCCIYVPDKYIDDFNKFEKFNRNELYSYSLKINVNENIMDV